MVYEGTYDLDNNVYTFDVKGSKVFNDMSEGKLVYLQFAVGATTTINILLLSAEAIIEEGEEDYYNFGYTSTYSNVEVDSIYSEGIDGTLILQPK